MKKFLLINVALLLSFSFVGCKNKKDEIKTTEIPVTESPTVSFVVSEEPSVTDIPIVDPELTETEKPAVPTEIPLDFQKEGWISVDESITLLKMYLGSYDDAGNEFVFGHESTIYQNGKYYYNFRITTLIISDTELAHQSYYGNYLVSTDGIDIIEYTTE